MGKSEAWGIGFSPGALDFFFRDALKVAGVKSPPPHTVWVPPVCIVREGDDIVVQMDVPGVRTEDITIEVSDDILTIAGVREPAVKDKSSVIANEVRSGKFQRDFALGVRIDPGIVTASCADGVLRVTLSALITAARPTRIPVSVEQVEVNPATATDVAVAHNELAPHPSGDTGNDKVADNGEKTPKDEPPSTRTSRRNKK